MSSNVNRNNKMPLSRRQALLKVLSVGIGSVAAGCMKPKPAFSPTVQKLNPAIEQTKSAKPSKPAMVFDSIQHMVSTSAKQPLPNGTVAKTLGYHVRDDGGGGRFIFHFADATDRAHDDGVVVGVPNSSSKWVREFDGPVNVRWFGACAQYNPKDISNWIGIQSAIGYVHKNGGGTLYVPNGVYPVDATLTLYRNMTLVLDDKATIRRDFDYTQRVTPTGKKSRILIGIKGDASNIVIRGGILDGNGHNYPLSFNIFGGRGFRNLLIENAQFLNVVDYHAIDFSASQNVTIQHCSFLGFANKCKKRHFSESIQIDPDLPMLGGRNLPSRNISIDNCFFGPNPQQIDPDFSAPACGIGNHAGAKGSFHQNIKITNCTFIGSDYAAIRPLNFSNLTIANNTFSFCRRAILVEPNNRFAVPECGSHFVIDSNLFKFCGNTATKGSSPRNEGVILFQKGKGLAPHVLCHQHIRITNNHFEDTTSHQILNLSNCTKVEMQGNRFRKNGGEFIPL